MDKNTENLLLRALDVTLKNYSKEEILEILRGEDEFEKPVAILEMEGISNGEEADLLLNHLTGCDGRIREAAAHKISEFLRDEKYFGYFLNERAKNVILDGICDINPNVGRLLGEGVMACPKFGKILLPSLIILIKEIIEKLKGLSDTPFKENKLNNKRNFTKNRIVFKLYWAMETLSFIDFEQENVKEDLVEILNFTSCYTDYTIREKCAKILAQMENPPYELLQKLKEDENFYVKNRFLC